MQINRFYPTSMSLPRAAQDYAGQVFEVGELGTDLVAQWAALGGDAFVWHALTPSYVGPAAGLPDPTRLRVGAWAVIDETAVIGLTRPPTIAPSGVKMRRVKLQVQLGHDGVTRQWTPMGAQTLFGYGGTGTAPVASPYTLAAASDVVCEFGVLPGNLLATMIGAEVYFRALVGRTGATGTADAAISLGTTPGTPGTALGVVPTMAANANSVAWIEGSLFVAGASSELITYVVPPASKSNSLGNLSLSLPLSASAILQATMANATVGQGFALLAVNVGVR